MAHTVSSLEDFFPERRKNPKINWFCLHYSSPCTGEKKSTRSAHAHTRRAHPTRLGVTSQTSKYCFLPRTHYYCYYYYYTSSRPSGNYAKSFCYSTAQRIYIRAYIIITYTPCRRLFRRRTHGASKHTTYCNIIINEYTTYTYLFCIHVYAVPW